MNLIYKAKKFVLEKQISSTRETFIFFLYTSMLLKFLVMEIYIQKL